MQQFFQSWKLFCLGFYVAVVADAGFFACLFFVFVFAFVFLFASVFVLRVACFFPLFSFSFLLFFD